MPSKRFLCLIGLTLCVLLIYVFYKTPNIVNLWPKYSTQSSSTSTSPPPPPPPPPPRTSPPPLPSKRLLNRTRQVALISASIHSIPRAYIFYTPIAAVAWQRIGYEVIVVFVGDFTNYTNNASLTQLELSRAFLQRLGVQIINFQCDIEYSIKISQIVRIFGGFLPDTYVNDSDIIITSDSDIIPIREQDYQLQKNADGFIYNSLCCGTFKRREKTHDMYPLSHICLRKKLWRDIFLDSIQRKELLESNFSSSDSLTEKAPFSYDTISLYLRHEFRELYDSKMSKGDKAWDMDQTYSSMLLNDYCEKHPNIKIDKRPKTSSRFDPDTPCYAWVEENFKRYGDAHLIHDKIFELYRWEPLKNLLSFLVNSSLLNAFDLYHKQFGRTL